jgi:hydroxyacylglutathione hydrolase
MAQLAQLEPGELHARLAAGGGPTVLDVRTAAEWRQGHLSGALHVPGGEVAERLDELPPGPLAVVCAGGYRSAAVASLLQRDGRRQVANVAGGMIAWKRARLPIETP